MRTILCILAAVLCLGTAAQAQDERLDEFSFDDLPEEELSNPYFALAGGFVLTVFNPSLTDANTIIQRSMPGSSFSTPVLLTGAQVFTGLGFIPNSRIGFITQSGSREVTNTLADTVRRGSYSVSFSGISLDYAFVLFPRFAVVPGVTGGWGTTRMEVSQSLNSREFGGIGGSDWDGSANRASWMQASHWYAQPKLDIEYAITQFSMIRLNAGYNFAFMGDWEADGSAKVNNVPNTFSSSGLTFQVGVFIGFFNN